jgi:hypothetical protein
LDFVIDQEFIAYHHHQENKNEEIYYVFIKGNHLGLFDIARVGGLCWLMFIENRRYLINS